MSASEHAQAFFREVAASGELFALEREARGPVTYHLAGGVHARPFWSSASRAVRMLEGPLRRNGLVIVPHPWQEFRDCLAPAMAGSGLLMGINWSGARARGYNLEPRAVVQEIERAWRRAG